MSQEKKRCTGESVQYQAYLSSRETDSRTEWAHLASNGSYPHGSGKNLADKLTRVPKVWLKSPLENELIVNVGVTIDHSTSSKEWGESNQCY